MRMLIADDEPTHLFLLEMFLKKWGYEVLSADNGGEAFRILCVENSPRMAILDWQLPGMNGIEICRTLRRSKERSYTYILLLSARAQKADILNGMASGADDYLTKPYHPEDLKEKLLTARKAVESADIPLFGEAVPGNAAIVYVR